MKSKIRKALLTSSCFLLMPVLVFGSSKNFLSKESLVRQNGEIGYVSEKTSEGVKITRGDVELVIMPYDGFEDESFSLELEKASWANLDELVLGLAVPGGTINSNGDILDSQGETVMEKTMIPESFSIDTSGNWDEDGDIIITRASDKELYVEAKNKVEESFKIPILAKATKGKISLHVEGVDSKISSSTHLLASTPDSDSVLFSASTSKRVDIPTIRDRGNLAEFEIEESYEGAFKAGSNKQREVTLYLGHPDFEFDRSMEHISIKYNRGLLGSETILAEIDRNDSQILKFVIPAYEDEEYSKVTISDISTTSKYKDISNQDIVVEIESPGMRSTELVLGRAADYGVSLDVKSDIWNVVSGRRSKVEILLSEDVAGSIIENRAIDLTLSDGKFGDYDDNVKSSKVEQFKKLISLPTGLRLIDVETDRYDQFIGFSVEVDSQSGKAREFPISFDFIAPIQFDGRVNLIVEGRALDESFTVSIARVDVGLLFDYDTMYLKPGLKNQVGGEIRITETRREMLKRGELQILIHKDDYVRIEELPRIEVSERSGLKIRDIEKIDTRDYVGISFEITRESREPADIYISEFDLTTGGMIPDGRVDAIITGSAIGSGSITIDDLLYVRTKDDNPIVPEIEKPKNISRFQIGSNIYTVNNEVRMMDAATYLSPKNRTMVPVRYLAEAFNIQDQQIQYNNGIITIIMKDRTIVLANNSNIAYVNGLMVTMDETVQMLENRSYAPVGEIGRLMNLEVNWDGILRTAEFIEK